MKLEALKRFNNPRPMWVRKRSRKDGGKCRAPHVRRRKKKKSNTRAHYESRIDIIWISKLRVFAVLALAGWNPVKRNAVIQTFFQRV
jgi:hypothetical protein